MNRRYGLWLSSNLMLLLFMAMVIYTFPLEPSIPYLQFTYSENAFKAVLEQWGSAGIERFRRHFVIDFPFLISYGIFGFLFSKNSPMLSRQTAVIRSLMVWGLPVAAGLDAVENLIHLHLIAGANETGSALYLAAGIVAGSKWMLIAAFVVATAYFWHKARLAKSK